MYLATSVTKDKNKNVKTVSWKVYLVKVLNFCFTGISATFHGYIVTIFDYIVHHRLNINCWSVITEVFFNQNFIHLKQNLGDDNLIINISEFLT